MMVQIFTQQVLKMMPTHLPGIGRGLSVLIGILMVTGLEIQCQQSVIM